MNLRGIVSVSGKPGLYKALAQNKSGFILESLDEKKNKLVTNANARIAALEEITVYGNSEDYKLRTLLESMKSMKDQKAIPEANADGNALRTFFANIAPDHDPERVYTSDIKKIISWYHILKVHPAFNEVAEEEKAPEVVEESPKPKAAKAKKESSEAPKSEAKPKATKAKTAPKKKKSEE
jgi:hypothetical protein